MRPQFYTVAAAALVLALPAGLANASGKIVGLFNPLSGAEPLDYIPIILKADMGFMTPLEGLQPEGWLHQIQAMVPIEQTIIQTDELPAIASTDMGFIALKKPEDGDGRVSAKFPNHDEGPHFKGPIDYQVLAGNYPTVLLPAGHMSEGGANPT